ncbi:acyl-CoA N-acyltransferase [Pleomassaria siparia CBS 279.74]|uniref:Acyl-CoA N-acyltransferase n=1 Tax=Pleomassaria siparia CBS 279.74 TaxID=1314801 RepID=A0A6G1JR58_9PLEO|nr:acyl-CoA N-acyltransferase [Pleomassaria siparia CBS 279.74]
MSMENPAEPAVEAHEPQPLISSSSSSAAAAAAAQAPASTTTTATSPLPGPIISTPRLILRPLHPLSFPHPYTLAHAETWISMNLTEPYNAFAICEISDPSILIGGIGLRPGSDVSAHTAEVGYWLGEPFTGKGYVTEACQAMTDWTFTERGDTYRKLTARVFSRHKASMRVLEKCGYKEEGVLKEHVRKHVEIWDLHLFGLLKREVGGEQDK